jgi:prophage antirepressor-like protein
MIKQNTNAIQQFHNDEFGSLEILIIDGKPYFPAVECAQKLGYSKPHNAITRHCPHSLKRGVGVETGYKTGGTAATQTVEKIFIPEGDLYRLIIRSKLPAAVRFEAWVFDTVLPGLREYNAYIMPEALEEMVSNPEFAAALLKELQEERDRNAELAPKARYYDRILQCKTAVPVSLIAKDYGISAAAFNSMLHDYGIQYRIAGTWLLYQKYAGHGYTQTKTYRYGEEGAAIHTCWTQKGRIFLYDFLAARGIFPAAELLNKAGSFMQMALDSII